MMDERIVNQLERAGCMNFVNVNTSTEGFADKALRELVTEKMTQTSGNLIVLELIELLRKAVIQLAFEKEELMGLVTALEYALEHTLDKLDKLEEEKRDAE